MFSVAFVLLAILLVTSVAAQNNCGVPGAVNSLKAQNTTNTTTHLSWQPPTYTECLDHYKITYCSYLNNELHECAFKTAILPLSTTQYDVTKLKPCTNNIIQVYTVGKDGRETYTKMLLYTGSGNPPKVNKLNVTYVGAINVTVDWNAPSGYKDQCYPGYKVCYSAKGDSKETCAYSITDEFTTSPSLPLAPCTEYNISVATVDGNFAADSKTSEKSYISVFTAPQMPNVTVEVHNHTAHVTWKTPDALSMTCAASYEVKNCRLTEVLYPEDCKTVSSQTLPLNATEATITNLYSCTNNQIFFNLVGHNGYSSSIEVVVQDPDIEIPAPSDFNITDVTTDEFTLSFYQNNDNCVDTYRACWFTGNEAETCWNTTFGWPSIVTDLDLTPCSNYTLHFTALGSHGKPSKNSTKTFLTGPANALDQLQDVSSHSALISWKAAPSTLQCGTGYNIAWWKSSSDSDTSRSAALPLNISSYNITDLTSCTLYVVSLSTNGTKGTMSSKSEVEIFTTLGDVKPLTDFVFFYVYDAVYVSLGFAKNTFSCVTKYVTCWHETGVSQAQEKCGEYKRTWASGELKACVNYTFVVNATFIDNTTISGSSVFAPGPEKIANLTVHENTTAQTANLSWVNPPTNHLCVQYIQVTTTRVDDNKVTTLKLSSDATTTTLTDITQCSTYLFEVRPVLSGVDTDNNYLTRYITSCGNPEPLP